MNYHSFVRSLASSALLVWVTSQTVSAQVTLDFVESRQDALGNNHATGELKLNSLNDGERPLLGSFFDPDGAGPSAPVDLAPFTWRNLISSTALMGSELQPDVKFILVGFGSDPNQFWQVATYDSILQGLGDWVPRTVPGGVGVPDAGATLPLFGMSLVGLVVAGRRWRRVA